MTAKKIDPAKRYKVTVKNSFKVGRSLARPGGHCVISGSILNDHKNDVYDYQEV